MPSAAAPAVIAARGRSRSGCRISLPIDDTSSTPMNAKHMTLRPEKISPADGRSGRGGAAAPDCHATRPAPAMSAAVNAVHTAPMFGSHLPTPRPTKLSAVTSASQPMATAATNDLSSTSALADPWAAYASTPAR